MGRSSTLALNLPWPDDSFVDVDEFLMHPFVPAFALRVQHLYNDATEINDTQPTL